MSEKQPNVIARSVLYVVMSGLVGGGVGLFFVGMLAVDYIFDYIPEIVFQVFTVGAVIGFVVTLAALLSWELSVAIRSMYRERGDDV